ncbi:MAG: NAD(P)H-binding protein [Thermoplasmatota archaeon]
MRVLLFGASGMVGKGVLLEALDAGDVMEVLSVGRSASGVAHPKLVEIVHRDFTDFSPLKDRFAGVDACFFCLGVSSAGMNEAEYARVTYDYTVAAAEALVASSPQAVFVYVSGAGTDSTEKGRTMWARVKGRTENTLLEMPFRGAYMFRPGLIRPERGITSRTRWYRVFYAATKPLAGLIARAMPDQVTTTTKMGRAMLEVARDPPKEHIVAPRDINALAARADGVTAA